jgi:uncharacterized protein YegP (UPF0339 family)
MGNFVIKKSTNEEYCFNLLADNSQIILTSKMYSSKSSCFTGIDEVRNGCSYDSYEQKQAPGDKHYFVLKASDGQIIGTSEMYSSKVAIEEEPYF